MATKQSARSIKTRKRIAFLFHLVGLTVFGLSLSSLSGAPGVLAPQGNSLEAGVNFDPAKAAEIRLNPDRYAWKVFTAINKAQSRPGNNNTVWENWIDSGLVYGDPNQAPTWPSHGNAPIKYDLKLTRTPGSTEIVEMTRDQQETAALPGTPRPDSKLEEIRMNRPTFDYIVRNQLWYLEGQRAAAATGFDLSFPPESIEVKAVWKVIGAKDRARYHTQRTLSDGDSFVDYGLVALHITTRDVPNWFWATFEHVDNPRRGKDLPSRDRFGLTGTRPSPALLAMFKRAGLGPEWTHYRLEGAQVDFVDRSGKPILVGNSEIEGNVDLNRNGMRTSSCITCHARSALNRDGRYLLPNKSEDPRVVSYVGKVDPSWFTDQTGKKSFMKRDFVWSLEEARCKCIETPTTTFKDIVGFFTLKDISCMKPYGVFLDDYTWMANLDNAMNVYNHLTGKWLPRMPLGAPWAKYKIDKFKAWIDGGRK